MDSKDFCGSVVLPTLTTAIDSIDYNMCHKYRGICLILDNENFAPHGITKNLAKRLGSKVDTDALMTTFGKLGFDVVVRHDDTTSGIRETLKQISLIDHSENDCFVCIVLTHGEHGHLYSYDGRYAIDHLFINFLGERCTTLLGKPKMFFIQACQGDRLDRGVMVSADALDAAHYFKIPTYADFMVAYSTLPGFYSFRNTEKGAWFINALTQILNDYHLKFDLLSMMTMVCHQVAYYYTSNAISASQSGMKQVPCITSMLTRRVFFQPKPIV